MRKGFTLIEILVVVVVISLLLSVSAFGIQGARESARNQRRIADMQIIRTGLSRFLADCGSYPTGVGSTPNEFALAEAAGRLSGIANKSPACRLSNVYIPEFPVDPESPSVFYYYEALPGTQMTLTHYVLCASLSEPPSPAQDTSACGSCSTIPGRDCNVVYTD